MKMFIYLLCSLWLSFAVHAAELKFEPATPIVEMNKSITLSVANTEGTVKWLAGEGKIQGEGNKVTYLAPEQVGLDAVTVLDSKGNVSVVKVVITPPNKFSPENAQWEVFTNRSQINALLLSDDGKTLWVGTYGGLEKRDAQTGEIQQVFLNTDGLPNNWVSALLGDGQNGMWIGTGGGLAHYSSQGQWQVFNTENSGLPSNGVTATALLSDTQGGLWIGTYSGGLAHYSPNKPANEQWQVFNMENSGLPAGRISNLMSSDNQGGLWVGTVCRWNQDDTECIGGGLAHYTAADGQWQVFNKDNSGLPSNYIGDILSDPQGGLWIGTYEGLAHYSPNKPANEQWQVFNQDNSGLPSNYVNALLSDNQGGLWIGTYEGLAHYSPNKPANEQWVVFNQDNSGLPYNIILALSSDNQGGLWTAVQDSSTAYSAYGNKFKLAHYTVQGKWQEFINENGLPDNKTSASSNEIFSLLGDGMGGVWINGNAHYTAQRQWQIFNPELDMTLLNVTGLTYMSLLSDNDTKGGLWVGGNFFLSGYITYLAHYTADQNTVDQKQWQVLVSSEDLVLPPNAIAALLVNEQGEVWLGTGGGGLIHRTINGQWQVFNTENSGLPSNNVYLLLSDTQGGLWIGTYEGLAHYSPNKPANEQWQVFNQDNSGLPSNYVNALLSDNQGGLWIETNCPFAEECVGGGLLAHYTANGQWKVFSTENSGLPSDHIRALLSDNQGGLWIGTWGGLAHYSPNKPANEQWQVFNEDNSGLPFTFMAPLELSDSQGGLWIGTYHGLAHYSPNKPANEQWQVFNTDNSGLPDNRVQSLLSDNQGGLWIGTDGGLAHLTFGRNAELCTQAQIDAATCQAIQRGKNAAIIVAAGGGQEKDSLWENTEAITSRIYRTFYRRGFNKSNIYYLSSKTWADFDGDGFNDRINRISEDRHLTLDDLKKSFEWAKGLGKLDQPLYFFFMDHGGEGKLHLAPNLQISAEDLKPLLDDYQATTGNQLIVVLEACHSGSLIPALTAPNRAIITSAKADEKAYFFEKKGFSRFFADYLTKGANFSEAFQLATRDQDKLRGKNLQFQTAGGAGMTPQTPQLDDNSDGKYDPTQDNNWLKTVYINGKFTTADDTLAIENLTPATTLAVGQPVQLQAKATVAQGTVKRVWAVIRPPKMAQVLDTNGTPILAFPRVNLVQATESPNTWQTTWNDATYNGNYTFTFYAEDNEKNIAGSDQDAILTVSGGIEPPAQAQVEIQLDKTRYQRGEQFKATLTENLGWGYDLYAAVVMPDGNYFTLKNTNELRGVKEAKPWYMSRKQGQPITLLDLTLPPSLPTGQYCLYGILSPEQNDVFEAMNKNLWVYGQQCFEVF